MQEWKNNIRKVVPYVPGEQPKENDVIKLNTNENPYGPSNKVIEIKENMNDLRLYPDPKASELIEELAKYHGLNSNQVFVGVGSDDVIAMSFLTYFNGELPILFPDITYSFYEVWADLYKIPYEKQMLDDNFKIKVSDYHKKNGGVIFPNPNAPTGVLMSLQQVEEIISHNQDVVVIVDEAYIDFGGETALELINKYDNLLVVRTFSKSRSMAGLRIGYAMGNEELISALNAVKHSYNSYTMNRPSLLLGVESIKDEEYFRNTVQKIINTRERFSKEMQDLGFIFNPSKSNFIFAKHKEIPAEDIFNAARKEKIFFRHFTSPRIDNYLRISIGTDEEMDTVIEFLKKYINNR